MNRTAQPTAHPASATPTATTTATTAVTPTATPAATPDRLTLLAFFGAAALGGTNFVAVRFSNRELDPLWGAGARFAVAAAIFAAASVVLRVHLPRGRDAHRTGLYGLLGFGLTYGLMYWGLQEVPAGITAVIMAIGPLLTLLLATAHGMERLHTRAVVGAVVVLLGSAVMFLQPGGAAFGWPRLAAVCLGALTAAESVIILKRSGRLHPAALNLVAMGTGALALLGASALAGEQWALPRQPATIAAFGYLVGSSVGLFLLVLVVVRRWTASASSYIFVVMPPVAMVLGSVLGGEPVTGTAVLGGLVVLAGVYTGALKRGALRRPGPAA